MKGVVALRAQHWKSIVSYHDISRLKEDCQLTVWRRLLSPCRPLSLLLSIPVQGPRSRGHVKLVVMRLETVRGLAAMG